MSIIFNKSKSPTKSRTVLSPSKTASRTREQGHDCHEVNTDHIVNKTACRLFHSLFRFTLSYAYNCETIRGSTTKNGAQCSCGGCEAAHAALTPTLNDNILEKWCMKLGQTPYDKLEDYEQIYLEKRLGLSNEDKTALKSDDSSKRIQSLSQFLLRLTPTQKKGTFRDTPTEDARNATYDNPQTSNRVDCYLERHLRSEEDTIAQECAENKKTPVEAFQTFQDKYAAIVKQMIENLQKDLVLLKNIVCSWDQLMSCQKALSEDKSEIEKHFPSYLEALAKYSIDLQARFDNRGKGTPPLTKLSSYLTEQQSSWVHKQLLKDKTFSIFKNNVRFLKIPHDADTHFSTAQREIEQWVTEAEHQLKLLDQPTEKIKQMLKHMCGEKQTTPTKKHMLESLTNLIPDLAQPASKTQKVNKNLNAQFSKMEQDPQNQKS